MIEPRGMLELVCCGEIESVVTSPPGFITCNPLGPRLTTSFPDIVATEPP
jgi:hypothetical protein